MADPRCNRFLRETNPTDSTRSDGKVCEEVTVSGSRQFAHVRFLVPNREFPNPIEKHSMRSMGRVSGGEVSFRHRYEQPESNTLALNPQSSTSKEQKPAYRTLSPKPNPTPNTESRDTSLHRRGLWAASRLRPCSEWLGFLVFGDFRVGGLGMRALIRVQAEVSGLVFSALYGSRNQADDLRPQINVQSPTHSNLQLAATNLSGLKEYTFVWVFMLRV